MIFYRYEIYEQHYYGRDMDGEIEMPKFWIPPTVTLYLHEYESFKETEKGYWIKSIGWSSDMWKKWIPKKSKKRFAYPTTEEALTNYIKRTEKRIDIIKSQLYSCEEGLKLAVELNNKSNDNPGKG